MGKSLAFVYGTVCYLLALGVVVYCVGFEENLLVPKSIDSGPVGPLGTAIFINVLLLALFVVQHTVMARPAFKAWWTTIVPETVERSTFVLASVAVFVLFFWQWRPMAGDIWSFESGIGYGLLMAVNFIGWGLFLWSTFLIDHFGLFGMKQVWNNLRDSKAEAMPFTTPAIYKRCRHPMMLGFLIAFWATPYMTVGHLFFSAAVTVYIFMGIWFEERDLVTALGSEYETYQQSTPMILPFGKKG